MPGQAGTGREDLISKDNKVERKGIRDSSENKGCEPTSFVILEDYRILMPQSKATLVNFKYNISILKIIYPTLALVYNLLFGV